MGRPPSGKDMIVVGVKLEKVFVGEIDAMRNVIGMPGARASRSEILRALLTEAVANRRRPGSRSVPLEQLLDPRDAEDDSGEEPEVEEEEGAERPATPMEDLDEDDEAVAAPATAAVQAIFGNSDEDEE